MAVVWAESCLWSFRIQFANMAVSIELQEFPPPNQIRLPQLFVLFTNSWTNKSELTQKQQIKTWIWNHTANTQRNHKKNMNKHNAEIRNNNNQYIMIMIITKYKNISKIINVHQSVVCTPSWRVLSRLEKTHGPFFPTATDDSLSGPSHQSTSDLQGFCRNDTFLGVNYVATSHSVSPIWSGCWFQPIWKKK